MIRRGSLSDIIGRLSNHRKNSRSLSSSRHKKGSNHANGSLRRKLKSKHEDESDHESVISSCSFASSNYQPPEPSTSSSLPVSSERWLIQSERTTVMFSNQSLKLIYLSWDVIKNMTEGKKKFGVKLFEILSEEGSSLALWFKGGNAAHQTSFVEMIDMLVSMLSPTDLDVVSEELISLGKRHARYDKLLIQAFLPSVFEIFSDAFCKALKQCVYRHLFGGQQGVGRENLMKRSSSLHSLFDDADAADDLEGKRPSSWDMVELAWQDLLWYIRCQMEEGAMMGYKDQKDTDDLQSNVEIEYQVELKGEDDEDEISSKPWSFSNRESSASTVKSSEPSISEDDSVDKSRTVKNYESSIIEDGAGKSRKIRRSNSLPRLRLPRLNSFGRKSAHRSRHITDPHHV